MKRALLGMAALAACGRGGAAGAPASELVIRLEADGLDAARLAAGPVDWLEHDLGSGGKLVALRSRSDDGRATIVAVPAAGVELADAVKDLQPRLAATWRRFPEALDRAPEFAVRELPETTEVFVYAGADVPHPVDALAALPGLRSVETCGVREYVKVLHVDAQQLRAHGLTLAQLAQLPDGSPQLAEVASVASTSDATCVVQWRDAIAPAIIEVRGHGMDHARLAALAASAGYAPVGEHGAIYTSRVQLAVRGNAAILESRRLRRAAVAAPNVAWAYAELDPAAGTVRIVVALAQGQPASVELEVRFGDDAAALAALAQLRAAGAVAGCDGCSSDAHPFEYDEIDGPAVRELGVQGGDVAFALAAHRPGGVAIGDARRLAITGDLSAIEVAAGSGGRVPLSTVVRAQIVASYPRLRDHGVPYAAVWVSAATEAGARAMLPAGKPRPAITDDDQ